MINVYYGGHSDITDHMKTRRYISLGKASVSTTRARDYFKIVSNLPSPTAEGAFTYHSVKYNFSFYLFILNFLKYKFIYFNWRLILYNNLDQMISLLSSYIF